MVPIHLPFSSRLLLTLVYVLMSGTAYCLMLLVMTFDYIILTAICLGLATGHFVRLMLSAPVLPF